MKVIRQGETPGLETHFAECARCHSLLVLDAEEYREAQRNATYCANCGWHVTSDDFRDTAR
jgi:hypothetical protein